MNKENHPLATIITPVFNSPDLHGAIDSVLKQTYPQIQYLIIDDCSTKFSVEKIEKYIQRKARANITDFEVVRNHSNLGTVKTLNRALTLAKGRFIFNLAGDDNFFDDNVIADWVHEFQKTQTLVITAYRDVYDYQLKHYINTLPKPQHAHLINDLSPRDLFEYLATQGNCISGSCTAISKECFEKYGTYDERYRYLEDYPFYLSLLRQGVQIQFLKRKVIRYRSGGISDTCHSINKELEKDQDTLYQIGIIPYTKNIKQLKKIVKYRQLTTKYHKQKFKLLLLYLWFYWKRPWVPIMKILQGQVSLW